MLNYGLLHRNHAAGNAQRAVPFWLSALPALLLGGLLLLVANAGYTAEDDAHYLSAADHWLAGEAFLGTTHWELRHPHIFAITASFLIFGRSEAAMMMPTLAAYFGVILITVWLLRQIAGHRAALLAGLFFAATPIFVFYARIPYPDMTELFFCVVSFVFLWNGLESGRNRWFVLAGLAMSMAWMIRSSTLPLIILYGILFLAGFGVSRTKYLTMAVGFAPPVLIEWWYYWRRAGDPFYRFAVDMNSLEIPTAHMVGKVAHGLRPPFNVELMQRWVPNSVVDVHWLVNPYIDFLTNPSFGLLYAAAIAASINVLRSGHLPQSARGFAWVVVLLAVLWIFCTIYVLNLRPQARYFMPVSWACCVLLGLGMDQFMRRSGANPRRYGAVAIVLFLLIDAALVSARKDPMQAERELVDFVASHDGAFLTDLGKARFLIEERGLANRVEFVTEADPKARKVYLVSTDSAGRWVAQGGKVVKRLPRRRSAVDGFWITVAPSAIAAKLRGDRGVVMVRRAATPS